MGNSPIKEFSSNSKAILKKKVPSPSNNVLSLENIVFAAGCFWSVELAFQRVPGVVTTEVGYTQGYLENPNYETVCTGSSGHVEAVRVSFDPSVVSLDELLTIFWDIHNPTTRNKQGGDVGTQYRSGVYYDTEAQKNVILASRDKEQKKYTSANIVTEVLSSRPWYAAEEYHQNYLEKGGQCAAKGDLTPIRCYG